LQVPEADIDGLISPGKINSPRCHLIAACDRTVGNVLVDMSNGEPLGLAEPGSPRSRNGPPEMAWNASVSPHRPTGPLETWLPKPVSPQLCPGPLETILPAPVSPHCLSGLLKTTMPGSVSPHLRAGSLEIVPYVHVSPQPRVGTPEMTPADVSPLEGTGPPEMAMPEPVSPQYLPGSLETAATLQKEPTKTLKVYYHRGSRANQFHDGQQDGTGRDLLVMENGHKTDPGPDAFTTMGAPSETRKEEFLNKICRRPDAFLLIPNRNSKKAIPPSQTPSAAAPRQSRRVAGAGVEFSMQDWGGRATKKAMRALQIIAEDEGISQEALKAYAELFKHPLSQNQVEALSALFGWSTPPEVLV
jgi:hypothetical protein